MVNYRVDVSEPANFREQGLQLLIARCFCCEINESSGSHQVVSAALVCSGIILISGYTTSTSFLTMAWHSEALDYNVADK